MRANIIWCANPIYKPKKIAFYCKEIEHFVIKCSAAMNQDPK